MRRQPFVLRWDGGEASAGYVGAHRWRCVTPEGDYDVGDTQTAVACLVAAMFDGSAPGAEAGRAPIRGELGTLGAFSLLRDERVANGWSFEDKTVRLDLGDHRNLPAFLRGQMARHADELWAHDLEPVAPAELGAAFSHRAFASDTDTADRCRELGEILSERARAHPCPVRATELAVVELRALGHDLWSWDAGEVWGRDYMTARRGAGLQLWLSAEDGPRSWVRVEFEPRSGEPS